MTNEAYTTAPQVRTEGGLPGRLDTLVRHMVLPIVHQALLKHGRHPVYKTPFVTRTADGAYILFVVIDDHRLQEPLRHYERDDLVHEISTNLKGMPVAISNHTGFRYAILLSRPPKLADLVYYPAEVERDSFPIGQGSRGDITLPIEKLNNIQVAGASRSGKSTFLTGLAYTAAMNNFKLFLADPQSVTFSHAWDHLVAAPIAVHEDFSDLLDQIDEEAARRLDLFARTNRKNGLPVTKIEEYNASVDSDRQMPRVMFIADEANNYLEDPQIKERITRIVRTSLKCGISTVLAAHSWRATDIPKATSAQFDTRVCFGTSDDTSGRVVLGHAFWGEKSRTITTKGRAIIWSRSAEIHPQFIQTYLVPEEMLVDLLVSNKPKAQADAPVDFPPQVKKPQLSDTERRAIALASQNAAEPNKITAAMTREWGLASSPAAANEMLASWRTRGLVAKDPKRQNAHFLTEKAFELLKQDQTNGFGAAAQ